MNQMIDKTTERQVKAMDIPAPEIIAGDPVGVIPGRSDEPGSFFSGDIGIVDNTGFSCCQRCLQYFHFMRTGMQKVQ